jgi:cell shape-determining protein MreD
MKIAGYALWLLKIISALVLGLTIALITQQMMGFATLGLVFLTFTISAVFLALFKRLTTFNLLIVDLICVLVGLVLKMYILMAP